MKLPKFITGSIIQNAKPDIKLIIFEDKQNTIIRYESIKTGGIVYQTKAKTKTKAIKQMESILKRYNY